GAFTPTITGGGSILPTGGGTTIVLSHEAYFELDDGTRYTCAAPDGCTIANGTVTAGAVTGRAAGAGEVGRFPGECRVGMTLSSGQSCTYPGAADEFSVNARGRGSFLGRLAGIRIRIDNETINGRVYDFEASHQGEGIWQIDRIAGGTEPMNGGMGTGGTGTDTSPSFTNGSRTGNQTYTVGTAIDTLTLPEARGGDGALTYSLSPKVPGLAFNATTRRLTGTPTVAANYNMTYSVKDQDGDTDTLTFSIIVQGSATGENTDRAVLVALYNATNGPNWTRRDNWLTDAPIGAWHGVTVSDGRIVSLSLYDNGLSGPIPPELGNLTRLVHLYLDFNDLTGPIPPELGELKSLEDLYLGSNALSGWIPPELGNLTRLGVLNLEFNTLTGPIPRELGNLPRVRILRLWINQLTGSIPQELGNLTLLEELWLSGNALTGNIPPELGQLLNLRYLGLADTSLTGTIPTDFASLRNLELLVPGGVCVPTDLLKWAIERRVSAFTCTPEGRLLPSALIREDGNGLSLALPGDLREPSAVTVSDSSVVAASVADGWLELLPRGLGEAEVVLVPSGGGAPANARVVVRAAVGTFGIDIVMDRPAPVTYEEALMVGADWWSSVLDGTEWPDRRPDCFSDRATALADELLIHARVDSETDAAGYALTCFRNDGNQAALDPGGGAIVAAPHSGNPYLVRHEIGHLLGLVLWGPESGLVVDGEENLYFTGEQALSAFHAAGGEPGLPGVPFDGVHWAFGVDDFMGTGLHGTVSAAALADSGYTVNIEKATDALGWSDRDLGNGQALADHDHVSEVIPCQIRIEC
ncbi:MAG: hypothetical protein OXQ89_15470, partial [Rhodospirillaceae bacterium]|nr:hypothetical protein [Rhodospirillaceae bacterium]